MANSVDHIVADLTPQNVEVDLWQSPSYVITLKSYIYNLQFQAAGMGPPGPPGANGTNSTVPGPPGSPGIAGLPGAAATIAVGTTSNLAPGSVATVSNSGSNSAAVFNFGIPSGLQGGTGATGPAGPSGSAATVAVGATSTLGPGVSATVTNTGTPSAAVLAFGIPQGIAGPTGAPGGTGTIAVGTTNTLAPGAPATVSNSGSNTAAVFNFGIPQGVAGAVGATGPTGNTGAVGPAGSAATIAAGTATGLPAGSNPTVTNAGSSSAAVFNFGIPAGAVGATGPAGPPGGASASTTLTSTFTMPAVGSNATANVANAGAFSVGGIVYINPVGYLNVQAVNSGANTLSLQNLGSAGNQTSGSTAPSGNAVTGVGPQGPPGATGATGATGNTGATGAAGSPGQGYTWHGTWSSATAYNPYDTVAYNGSSYVCILANTNQVPTNTSYWNLIAQIGATGATGATGSTGSAGSQGPAGTAATITAGTATGLAPGSNPTVSNSGSSSAAVFNFGIPQGATGATGAAGAAGSNGAAATIAVGTTNTLSPGTSATVSNSGSSSAATFNFGIPQGVAGANGTNGTNGANSWTLTTAGFTVPAIGSSVTASVSDTSWVALNEVLWIQDANSPGVAGPMQVTAKTSNSLTLLNPSVATTPVVTYDLSLFAPGIPAASALTMRAVFCRAVTFPVNLTGSVANAGTAATASTVFNVAKNGTNVGTLTFAASGKTGTFSVAASQSFVSGDILTITAPATPDTTLANISVTLTGTRN